jgi:hypothetical protein
VADQRLVSTPRNSSSPTLNANNVLAFRPALPSSLVERHVESPLMVDHQPSCRPD